MENVRDNKFFKIQGSLLYCIYFSSTHEEGARVLLADAPPPGYTTRGIVAASVPLPRITYLVDCLSELNCFHLYIDNNRQKSHPYI